MYLQGMKIINKCPDLTICQEKKKQLCKSNEVSKSLQFRSQESRSKDFPVLAHTVLCLHVVGRHQGDTTTSSMTWLKCRRVLKN